MNKEYNTKKRKAVIEKNDLNEVLKRSSVRL